MKCPKEGNQEVENLFPLKFKEATHSESAGNGRFGNKRG